MRILIDLLNYTGERGGTETYARQIARRLPEVLPGVELIALVNRPSVDLVRAFFPGDVVPVRWVGRDRATWALAEMVSVGRAARRLQADVIWAPANFGPMRRAGVPFVLTFHDVVYQQWRGNLAESIIRSTAWRMMLGASKVADAIITGSEAAAAELVSVVSVPRELITVIPHGTNAPTPSADPWSELTPLGLTPGRPLIISTGNRLPHKNFIGILNALAALPPAERPLAVIPGAHGDDPLASTVRDLGLETDVILPGWVTLAQLEALYSVADLYVCPSLTEGFGLPVVDAMRRGCPVLANDIPVLREVGGDAARYADATNPAAFAAAITSAVRERNPASIEAAKEWSTQFTWERSAAETAAVFTSVIGSGD